MLILLDKLKYIPDSTALYSCKFDLVFSFLFCLFSNNGFYK